MDTKEKLERLKEFLSGLENIAVAFSAGVDSTFLLKISKEILGPNVLAITARSKAFPKRELQKALDFCAQQGISQVFCDCNELQIDGFDQNPINRCYICKKNLLKKFWEIARDKGIRVLAEGSNADDEKDFRPGMTAVIEEKVISPLKAVRLTKNEIRELSKEAGLDTWNKPAIACLYTRFPYGETISLEALDKIDRGEQFLQDVGLKQLRLRLHKDLVRIETDEEGLGIIFKGGQNLRKEIYNHLKDIGFSYVSLDLIGYRMGSMNEPLE